jgi:hypothetical protein
MFAKKVVCGSLRRLRELRQALRSSVRTELSRSLIPLARFDIGLNSDSAEPPDEKRVERPWQVARLPLSRWERRDILAQKHHSQHHHRLT